MLSPAGGHRFLRPSDRAVRYLQRVLRGMLLTAIEVDDADYPVLVRLFDSYLPYGNSNPDCILFSRNRFPSHTYRISGQRGNARIVESPGHGWSLRCRTESQEPLHASRSESRRETAIWRSRSAPRLSRETGSDSTRVRAGSYLRQYFYDWEAESPGRPGDRAGGRTVSAAATLARRNHTQDREADRVDTELVPASRAAIEGYYDSPPDRCTFNLSTAGMDGLLYGKGHFSIADEQAAILEFRPPDCRYWSFQVMNDFWESQEFDLRQTSLNGHQAPLDPDGVFRGVISVNDPGYPQLAGSCRSSATG